MYMIYKISDTLWQIKNFHFVFYAGIIGITIDLISFGDLINYYAWLTLIILGLLNQFNNLINNLNGWKYIKLIL